MQHAPQNVWSRTVLYRTRVRLHLPAEQAYGTIHNPTIAEDMIHAYIERIVDGFAAATPLTPQASLSLQLFISGLLLFSTQRALRGRPLLALRRLPCAPPSSF